MRDTFLYVTHSGCAKKRYSYCCHSPAFEVEQCWGWKLWFPTQDQNLFCVIVSCGQRLTPTTSSYVFRPQHFKSRFLAKALDLNLCEPFVANQELIGQRFAGNELFFAVNNVGVAVD